MGRYQNIYLYFLWRVIVGLGFVEICVLYSPSFNFVVILPKKTLLYDLFIFFLALLVPWIGLFNIFLYIKITDVSKPKWKNSSFKIYKYFATIKYDICLSHFFYT